ncbi:MAG: M28 family peptidase [Dysgonamonadaceae bacterium]|jgi:hypothetical protein|nr:M28 family peptidase [Dysgonamonadaceae bacterium]
MLDKLFFAAVLTFAVCSCGKQAAKVQGQQVVAVPEFNVDSAYHYTAEQVSFGPRVPNTSSHEACAKYLADKLKTFGFEVTVQATTLHLLDGTPINIKNIIGVLSPEKTNRIMLCAHWDSRPFADYDPNPANRNKAIDGANDGAGACAALLEIARQAGLSQPAAGVDIILFDAEDWGKNHDDITTKHHGEWCMGSHYWAKNPHTPDYHANYGILLDMVSGYDAQFYKEYYSMEYASHVVQKVWNVAQAIGYGNYFPNRNGGAIEDDHLQVNLYRQIPCIDIIQYEPDSETGFADFWHTLDDNMEHISRETLKAVGQTVLHVIYSEK